MTYRIVGPLYEIWQRDQIRVSGLTSKAQARKVKRLFQDEDQQQCRGVIAQAGAGIGTRVDGPSRAQGPIVPSRVDAPAAELPRQKRF